MCHHFKYFVCLDSIISTELIMDHFNCCKYVIHASISLLIIKWKYHQRTDTFATQSLYDYELQHLFWLNNLCVFIVNCEISYFRLFSIILSYSTLYHTMSIIYIFIIFIIAYMIILIYGFYKYEIKLCMNEMNKIHYIILLYIINFPDGWMITI